MMLYAAIAIIAIPAILFLLGACIVSGKADAYAQEHEAWVRAEMAMRERQWLDLECR